MVKIVLHQRRNGSFASKERLHDRRLKEYRRKAALVVIFSIFLGVLMVIGLWQPIVRVRSISFSEKSSTLLSVVNNVLAGTYADIVPRDSIFFLPTTQVRKAILSTDQTITAVSIVRVGFDAIAITVDARTPLGMWCGTPATSTPADTITKDITQSVSRHCYFFDGTGFLYASTTVPVTASSSVAIAHSSLHIASTTSLISYPIYALLISSSSPTLFNTISRAKKLPAIFDFAKYVDTFNVRVVAVVIRGDEADLFLNSGTRVTYVIGDEQDAAALLVATKNKISLANGSLVYVDLRFPGKVYFMRKKDLVK